MRVTQQAREVSGRDTHRRHHSLSTISQRACHGFTAYSLRNMRLPLSTFTMASDAGGSGSLAAAAGLSSVGCCEGGADAP